MAIVGCGDHRAYLRWFTIDTCIAMENMVPSATGGELGTCWIGLFNEGGTREMLRIPTV